MKTQKKLSILFSVIIAGAFGILMVIVAFGFYNLGTSGATQKANLTTELVKDGLTAHMINGIMDNRDFFLKRIENIKTVDELWITRAPSVVRQFGSGYRNEMPRDKIDKNVIRTGKRYRKLYESTKNVKLRFTVPYVASSFGTTNCMDCHDAKEGEVLGTVSMIFDVSDTRSDSIATIGYVSIVAVFVMILVLFVLNRSLKPIWRLFNSINNVMGFANSGNYSKRILVIEKHGESKQVAIWINSFLNKLESTLDNVQTNVKDFFVSYQHAENDPLLDAEQVIVQMADIYRFKKTIEFDEDKATVYERLATILKQNLKLDNFKFFESNNETGEIICVYGYDRHQSLNENIKNRALRTKQFVASNQFENICHTDDDKNGHYLCIPYSIGDDFDLLIHFSFSNEEVLEHTKKLLPKIENYVDAARPELVSKNLTEILRHSSTTDQLTGLYNRKFLDEFIEKTTPQTLRSNGHYGILMLDIDFFKSVNDTYGHDVGDKVIKVLSESVLKSIRDADIAFRYGGEEFLVMLYNCEDEHIDLIANKIRTTFSGEKIKTSRGETFSKTLSIGYSRFPSDSDSIWRCIKFADIALYEAKETGRNKVIKFVDAMLGEGELKTTYTAPHQAFVSET